MRILRCFPWHTAGALFLLAATLLAYKTTGGRPAETLARPLDTIPWQMAGFQGSENPALTDGVLAQLKPTSYLSRTYRKDGLEADLFIAYYAQQRAGESMHSPKHCLPGSGWEIWDYGSTDISAPGGTARINRYNISRNGQRMVVFYWYQSRERIIASEYLGKILLARDTLLRNSTAGSIVRVVVPDLPQAKDDARAMAAALIPQVRRCFGE